MEALTPPYPANVAPTCPGYVAVEIGGFGAALARRACASTEESRACGRRGIGTVNGNAAVRRRLVREEMEKVGRW